MPPTHHHRLFNARLVRDRVAAVPPSLFEQHRKTVEIWLGLKRSGALQDANEVQLHGGFLERIFGDVLGYRTMATSSDGRWDLTAEKRMDAGGSADGAIGMFAKDEAVVIAPIELKGATQNLDRAMGRNLTPVQQGWDYANKCPSSRWVIVSSYVETRLYAVSAGLSPSAWEDFFLDDLATPEGFNRFYALLGRQALLGGSSPDDAPLRRLLIASQSADQEVTANFYEHYREIRIKLVEELLRVHSNRSAAELVGHAQIILDRILFIAFAEDRGLIPPNTIATAFETRNRFRPRPVWDNFLGLFQAIDRGSSGLGIPAYNGGLFSENPALDDLELSDSACEWFKEIAAYNFLDDVSVEVLGHVFEQSISDLESLRAQAEQYRTTGTVPKKAAASDTQKRPSKRRAQGIFYTPPFVTSFLVRETLGRAFSEAWERCSAGRGRSRREQLAAHEDYREALRGIRVLDPACGSGAFLVAAFDALAHEFEQVNRKIAELNLQQASLFDLNKTVLNENLFGIDLNGESVEITRLALWLKTAERDRKLTFLDRNIRTGNTVVSDPRVDPRAFDWAKGRPAQGFLEEASEEAEAIDARWRRGFSVVIGNPPYVRQELLGRYKEHWKSEFEVFDGVADLFVYFFERGVQVLQPGGRLGFIVSNKWLRGGYAERLRELFARKVTVERIVDFGHAPIFPDADAFPCIVVLRKNEPEPGHQVTVTQYPREELDKDVMAGYVDRHRFVLPQSKLGREGWSLEPPGVAALMEKIKRAGVPLAEYAKTKPYYGIKTGCNEAFLVDDETRKRLCKEDPRSKEVLKKYLRGQDIKRWAPSWAGLWILLLPSSGDRDWPWAAAADEAQAEERFRDEFPAIHAQLKPFESRLRLRTDRGRFWWELRACAYYDAFERPALLYPDILWRPDFAHASEPLFANNTVYVLPSDDAWLHATMSTPAFWAFLWRTAQHGKDEALRMFSDMVITLPIPTGSDEERAAVAKHRAAAVAATLESQSQIDALLDLLRTEYGIDAPGNALADPVRLTSDEFIAEVKKRRPKGAKWTSAAHKHLRELFDNEIEPMQERQSEVLGLERLIAAEVHRAYGLTPEDEQLLWDTAPPRMPVGRPGP